jgi:hypothetical protein
MHVSQLGKAFASGPGSENVTIEKTAADTLHSVPKQTLTETESLSSK